MMNRFFTWHRFYGIARFEGLPWCSTSEPYLSVPVLYRPRFRASTSFALPAKVSKSDGTSRPVSPGRSTNLKG